MSMPDLMARTRAASPPPALPARGHGFRMDHHPQTARPAQRFAVLGAGNAGLALAAYLSLRGFEARLHNRGAARLHAVRSEGGVWLEWPSARGGSARATRAFASLAVATTSLAEAIGEAEVILVATPATAHRDLAAGLAPHLRDGQAVVLNPGRTGGALEFRQVLDHEGCTADVVVAEAETLVFACRADASARATIFGAKRRVRLAALPARRTVELLHRLRPAFPQFGPAQHVLATGFANIGAVFHPAPLLLNLGRVEAGHAFEYYHGAVTPSVARVMEAVDAERLAVARAWGVRVPSAVDWLADTYGTPRPVDGGLHAAILATPAYAGIQSPATPDCRYLTEDVPAGLVPLSELGRAAGVATPHMDALVELASTVQGVDLRSSGRRLDRLGIAGRPVWAVRHFVLEGSWCS